MGNRRVLVVEDEPLIRDLLVAHLCETGYIVVAAGNALEAFEAHRQMRIDLLFCDLRGPGAMDGRTLVQRMRELSPGLPVVHASGEATSTAAPTRHTRILKKPFRVAEAIAAIDGLIERVTVERLDPVRLSSFAA